MIVPNSDGTVCDFLLAFVKSSKTDFSDFVRQRVKLRHFLREGSDFLLPSFHSLGELPDLTKT